MARVLFLGRLRDVAGAREIEIAASSLSALRHSLARDNAALAEALAAPGVLIAVDKAVQRGDVALNDASEVAFMPPLSGG